VTVIVVFSLGPVRRALKAKFDDLLIQKLGKGAAIASMKVGLKSVALSGVVLPLDKNGSELRIRDAKIAIVASDILSGGEQLERIVRTMRVSGVEVYLRTASSSHASDGDSAWLPKISVPRSVYKELLRLDSLNRIEISDAAVVVAGDKIPPRAVCRLNGVVERRGNGMFQLAASGYYLGDSANAIHLTGNVSALARSLELQAVLTVPPGKIPLLKDNAPVITSGGRVSARVTASDDSTVIHGGASLDDFQVATRAGDVRIKSLRASLSDDTLLIEHCDVTTPFCTGSADGDVILRGKGALRIDGDFRAENLAALHDALNDVPALEGAADLSIHVRGSVSAPDIHGSLRSAELTAFGKQFAGVQLEARLGGDSLRIESFACSIPEGKADLNGTIRNLTKPNMDLRGGFVFTSVPSVLGWKSGVSELHFNATGPLTAPRAHVILVSNDGRDIGDAALLRSGDDWEVDFQPDSVRPSRIQFGLTDGGVKVTARDVQTILTLAFPDLRPALEPLREFDLHYEGNGARGTVQWDALLSPDSTALLPQIAREAHFSGSYNRQGPAQVALEGKWTGVAGDGYPFDGRADLRLEDKVLLIDRVFIDAAGELRGRVDVENGTLALELEVNDLPLRRLPIRPVTESAINLNGTLSGIVSVLGSFEKPDWQADLSMIDGTAFGVPGYWLNLQASGEALAMDIEELEIGRDVRRIVDASGNIDFGRNQISITAEVGSARAEDFVLALTGRQGIISGELAGRGAISGDLNRPDVEVELSVHDGNLLRELHVDDFTASFRTEDTPGGERILRIPSIRFSKANAYQFELNADLVPRSDGALHAHIEGSGDFLDLVEQLESSFHTHGSTGSLHLDFGGTVSRPRFLGGEFSLTKGEFDYRGATPDLVGTDIKIELTPEGVVQSGEINFRSGNQWVRIETIPDCDSTVAGLEPLIIPRPHVCLGVLQIETGSEGMPLHLPGLMRSDWYGNLIFGSSAGRPVTISGIGSDRLLISGNALVEDARVTFPFVGSGPSRPGAPPHQLRPVEAWLVQRLVEGQWNMDVAVGTGCRYDVEITGLKDSELFGPLRNSAVFETLAGYLDHLSIDAMLDPGNLPLGIRGCLNDTTFHLNGRASSLRGKVDYLDQTFDIEHVYADFDETNVMPTLEGRASTTGVDSTGRSVPVYLTLYQIDRETGTRQPRGRLSDMTVVLEGDANQTPEQVLALLGYTSAGGNVSGKAEQVVASTFARALGRQWINPLTRRLERWTWLDEISISPGGGHTAPLTRQQRTAALQADSTQQLSAFRFFTGSQLTVGKYLTRDLFFTYTGELSEGQSYIGPYQKDRLGLIHTWNLEYRINPLSRDLVLDFAVEYDEVIRRRDESVSLKYFFALEP
jgi:hypothetical protein